MILHLLYFRQKMCILFIKFLKNAKPGEFKLILASNRDEYFKRPGRSAHFWEEDANIFGGRDMTENKEGGTWLAMSRKGKLGVLLNVTGEDANCQKLGRGFLVSDYLKSSLPDKEYLEKVVEKGPQYSKFHLITAFLGYEFDVHMKTEKQEIKLPRPCLLHCSNSNACSGISEIGSDVFAVGNSPLENPFRKVTKGKERFEEICSKFGRLELKDKLLQELLFFLKWEEKHYPDEVIDSLSNLPPKMKLSCSAVFVNAPEVCYGTRTHTIVLVNWENKVEFHEWTLKEPIDPQHMVWKETHEEFNVTPVAQSKEA